MRPSLKVAVLVAVVIGVTISGLAGLAHATPLGPGRAAKAGNVFAQKPCTPVYVESNVGTTVITDLLGGTDVTPLGQSSANGSTWQHVRIWSGIEGYVLQDDLGDAPPTPATEGTCEYPGVPDPQSAPLQAASGPWPLTGQAVAASPAAVLSRPDGTSVPVGSLAVGTQVSITQWASDGAGGAWYQATTGGASALIGWIWSGALRLTTPNPATQTVKGVPIWRPMAGKGMWFTNYLTHHSDVASVVRAAKLAGITHLYAEVAITQFGFYGQNTLDRLLPLAHQAGIAVIGWVYPTLHDVATDVRLTQIVAQYVTPSGDHVDGIATDVEEADDSASVYTYGQLLRAVLGPDALLVAAVFHPYAQPYYPYAAIAASWNVIAPMDYWHSLPNHAYSQDDVRRFVSNSLVTVQAAMTVGGDVTPLPMEELGQTYDMYTQDGTGAKDAPTGPEITADMQAAHTAGCIGVSYFEWQTATQAEWSAIGGYAWPAT
jgi:hypothetical protein